MTTNKDIKIIDNKLYVNTPELCAILGITQQALSLWEKQGCPKEMRGWWCIADVLRWRGNLLMVDIESDEDIDKLTLKEQKMFFEIRLKQTQIENQDFKNAIAKGDYLLKTDVVSDLQKGLIVLKRSFLALGRKIATDLSGKLDSIECRKVESRINDIVYDGLDQISINGVYDPKKTDKALKKNKAAI